MGSDPKRLEPNEVGMESREARSSTLGRATGEAGDASRETSSERPPPKKILSNTRPRLLMAVSLN
jgi:hypothetical protein